jgi:hypothetical protein
MVLIGDLLAKLGLFRGCQLKFLSHSHYFFPFISAWQILLGVEDETGAPEAGVWKSWE